MNNGLAPDELRKKLAPVCARADILLILLFGSRVSGLTHARSDVDVAILGTHPLDMVEVTGSVMRLLRSSLVDVVDLRRASPLLAMEVIRKGRLLYERDAGAYAEFCSLAHRKYVDTAKLRRAQQEAVARFLRARGVA